MGLKIEYLDKKQLKPYANNAKIHTPEQVEQIKNSIRQFGFNDPIAIWHENEIIEGHGRLLAATEMDDVQEIPVIRLDGLTDEQRRAYMLVHNKLTMNTDFDIDLLSKEIADLSGGLDLTDLGFNEREILELTIDDSPKEFAPAVPAVPAERTAEDPDVGTAYVPDYYSDHRGGDPVGEPILLPITGNGVTREEINQYSQQANQMVTRRVIIVYSTEEEEAYLKRLLSQETEKPLGVVIDVKSLMKGERNGESEE